MSKALDYLYRMKEANEEMGYEAVNINEAIEELENSKSCKGCIHNTPENVQCIYCSRNTIDYYEAEEVTDEVN